jgi:hypothetical protein
VDWKGGIKRGKEEEGKYRIHFKNFILLMYYELVLNFGKKL